MIYLILYITLFLILPILILILGEFMVKKNLSPKFIKWWRNYVIIENNEWD